MSKCECKFHSNASGVWSGLEKKVDLGILGEGSLQLSVNEDTKVMEVVVMPPDITREFFEWDFPVKYCPMCGRQL
ncbi:hypothetical protein SAMN04487884_12368 [Butyrivibrio fibrisolvens]|uniref:Uncharacterized protein n=1 Tax=Butyrivibrio fibrisolvens TaxID=831 RepID=A0A1H9VKA1_BUTFI|nr:hypothetical protein [Butyrivibrio fibrisolvens]SES21767.1 hypothetical protein SAMN04487884_12368 [Butyrivibrio fibrisolvens]